MYKWSVVDVFMFQLIGLFVGDYGVMVMDVNGMVVLVIYMVEEFFVFQV